MEAPTAEQMIWSEKSLIAFFENPVNAMCGDVCHQCKKTANVPAGGYGWFCVCGHYNMQSTHHHDRLYDNPDLGNTRRSIELAIEVVVEAQKTTALEEIKVLPTKICKTVALYIWERFKRPFSQARSLVIDCMYSIILETGYDENTIRGCIGELPVESPRYRKSADVVERRKPFESSFES